MQHALDQEVAQFGQKNVGAGKMADGHRQRSDMVVMAMGNRDAINLVVCDEAVERKALATFAFGVRARIHEQAISIEVDKPCAGADLRIGVQIDDFHRP